MGSCVSTPRSSPDRERCACLRRQQLRCEHTPSKKAFGRNLSAAFSVVATSDDEEASLHAPEKLNVNVATEEELMTLPSMNRATARNIVEYRRQIGGFRRIEDMALVSGVGAARLDLMRHEICVNGGSGGSLKLSLSDTPSGSISAQLDATFVPSQPIPLCTSLPPPSTATRQRTGTSGAKRQRVDVNVANVFQLMRIKGLGLTAAQHIVEYRTKHGPFETPDALLKVKGVSPALLGSIRHQIVVEASEQNSSAGDRLSNSDSGVALPPAPNGNGASLSGGTEPGSDSNRRTAKKGSDDLSAVSLRSRSGAPGYAELVGTPFAAASGWQRPLVAPPLISRKDGRAAVRVATWNLQQCGEDKISNPGVLEVVCMTVLENGFGIVAFQEIGSTTVLGRIRDELNAPTLAANVAWGHRRGCWEAATSKAVGRMFQATEYNGFLYDTEQGVALKHCGLLELDNDRDVRGGNIASHSSLARRPFYGDFQAGNISFTLVSVHLKSAGLMSRGGDSSAATDVTSRDEVQLVTRQLRAWCTNNRLAAREAVMLIGDFNVAADCADFDELRHAGYENLVPANVPTNISTKNPAGTQQYDNLWASSVIRTACTGTHGVVRTGLSSPWIPDGWTWGGIVSDHCPVWAELLRSDIAMLSTDVVAAGMLQQLSLVASDSIEKSANALV